MTRRPIDIVVPVLNEADNVDEFIARVARQGLGEALIFVDNGSTDGTLERLARHPEVTVIRHARNEGYGASIRDGIRAGCGEKILIIDADLEYPPEALPALAAALDRAPVVYASRFRGGAPAAMPLARRLGNAAFTALFNRLFGQHTTDLYTGMKGLRRDAVPLHRLRRRGFEHAAELSALAALSGHHIEEIAVTYTPRARGRSKMRHLPEALKLVAALIGYRLRGAV